MAPWLVQWTPLGIIALSLFSHSASPRLERTGYGTRGGAAEVSSIGTIATLLFTPIPKALEPSKTLLKGLYSVTPFVFTYQSYYILFGAC